MRRKKIVSMLLVATMAATLFAGCGNDSGKKGGTETGGVKEFDAFFAVPGSEINDDNEIQKIIEEKTGVRVKETWLTGQTADEAVGTMIAGGEYPDFIEGASGQMQLYEAGALVPLDDYIEKYPNIKNLFTELEWEKLRQDDGHIYWIPQFSCIKGEEKACAHNDEAFWIQARVLKWANYPEIKTLDQYFDLIEKYNEANPTMADGTKNIPYTILCDDWRYFCLENAPQFLDGYPNDGSCMVDPDTKKVLDYNTSDTAVKYFKKLNEEELIGMAPDVTRYFIELRGIGIIDVKTLYGVQSVEDSRKIDLVIKLEDWDREREYDRLGLTEEYEEILGNKIVCHSIPVRPGRNLAIITEAAAINHRQKEMGYNAAQELYRRVTDNLNRKDDDDEND